MRAFEQQEVAPCSEGVLDPLVGCISAGDTYLNIYVPAHPSSAEENELEAAHEDVVDTHRVQQVMYKNTSDLDAIRFSGT